MMSAVTKLGWLKWSGAVLGAQLLLFAYIHIFMIGGAPRWAELPYEPFQALLERVPGQDWGFALFFGVVVGTLVYSVAFGFLLAWAFRRRAV